MREFCRILHSLPLAKNCANVHRFVRNADNDYAVFVPRLDRVVGDIVEVVSSSPDEPPGYEGAYIAICDYRSCVSISTTLSAIEAVRYSKRSSELRNHSCIVSTP